MTDVILFLGLVVLTAGLFSFAHPLMKRLGIFSVGLTMFAAGYLPTRSVWVGAACASVWLLLPVLEILLRVHSLRLPMSQKLRQTAPPGKSLFPELYELSDEIEESQFEHVADLGWDIEGYRQFFRIFVDQERRAEVSITYVEQHEVGFHFASVTSRTEDGRIYTTWNCAVSASLKFPPTVRLHRVPQIESFSEMLEEHSSFLKREEISTEKLKRVEPDAVRAALENDMTAQMEHNLQAGLLRKDGEGFGRYSWRGMVFLWYQVVRDIIKAS